MNQAIDILKNIENKINGKVVYCTDLPWDETMRQLKESTVLVIPSRMESIPQIIKEAFFLKIPVIATNVGGIPEIIHHDKTGILVPPNNSDVLLESINNFLEQPVNYDSMIKNAYEFIKENFSWDALLPNYVSFYRSLK